jgi:nitrous oxide reductase
MKNSLESKADFNISHFCTNNKIVNKCNYPDQFSRDSIVAKKGDSVKIHFYNLEPVESQEHHSFTITSPYDVNYDVNAGEVASIDFTATESRIFDYFCTYHQPTMRGQLIILDN